MFEHLFDAVNMLFETRLRLVSGVQELSDTFLVDIDEGDTITDVERGFLSLSLIFGKKK